MGQSEGKALISGLESVVFKQQTAIYGLFSGV
jgi:hypothetical protein